MSLPGFEISGISYMLGCRSGMSISHGTARIDRRACTYVETKSLDSLVESNPPTLGAACHRDFVVHRRYGRLCVFGNAGNAYGG